MKNKGFTLIELLAVIVILALIALVTIPMINNVIEKAKKGALEDSVYGLKSAAELYYSTTGTSETIEFTCTTEEGCKTDDGKKLPFKGSVEAGKVKLFSDGKVSICLTEDGYGSSILADEKKVTTKMGGCDEETYKVSEVIAIEKYNNLEKELDNVKNEFSSVKTTLYNKTLISSVDNDTDTINEEIENVNLNQGETVNKKAIADSLKYSGLGITEDMSWEEITTILSNKFPATLSMLRSGWTVSYSSSYGNVPTTTANTSQVYFKNADPAADKNCIYYYTSPEFDITAYKTLSVIGSSWKQHSNTSGNGYYCPTLQLLDASGNVTQLYQHANVNSDNSIYSINISKDVSNLKGMYRFRIQIGSYGYYNSYIASMTLTKLLLTA